MTRIGSALIASDDIDLFAQMIDNFSFSFIAPLGTDNDLYWHMYFYEFV
jgi:hypothetical protein